MQFSQFINEKKQVGVIYHLMSIEKMEYVIKNNKLSSRNFFNGISTTRDKSMRSYVGSDGMVLFKFKLDGDKLSEKYKISPYRFRSRTGVWFDEFE
jgi:hypothetical protein